VTIEGDEMRPNTFFILMAQYNRTVIPLSTVVKDYFPHLTEAKLRKALAGQVELPITRIEGSQKAARGVHISDLADYIDDRRAKALKECCQLNGRSLVRQGYDKSIGAIKKPRKTKRFV
jgi:Pyocin activator protein PrtN